jgi:uncharacterized protein (DUF488 family)
MSAEGVPWPRKTNLFTIGHSTHPLEKFVALLGQHGIEVVADIRRFPGSRKFPQFNQDELVFALQKVDIDYHWLEALGGRRGKRQNHSSSINLGLHNASFRNYADYMLTKEFDEGMTRLLDLARCQPTTLMCAEALFWRCHRRLVSDFLVANGVTVQHIMANGDLQPHSVTLGAVIKDGGVTYPAERSLFN